MFNNWKHIVAVIGSLLTTTGPYIVAMNHWDDLFTPVGLGGLLIVLGGWFTGLCTYSLLLDPIGAPGGSK